jgi:hypothetical protein
MAPPSLECTRRNNDMWSGPFKWPETVRSGGSCGVTTAIAPRVTCVVANSRIDQHIEANRIIDHWLSLKGGETMERNDTRIALLLLLLWRIRTMECTPSPASDDLATERCRCYGNGQVNTPPLPSPRWRGSASHCDITSDTAVDSGNRQQAIGNGIKSRRGSMWS